MPDALSEPAGPAFRDAAILAHEAFREACRIVDAGVSDDGPEIEAFFEAKECFIEAPVSSLEGARLKLEWIHELEDIEGMAAASPRWALPRVLLSLIRDLRAAA